MQTLLYEIQINRNKSHVWQTMLDDEKYHEWVKTFSEGSTFIGQWAEGETVRFFDPNMGGTQAVLDTFQPYDIMRAVHNATINQDGTLNTEDETAQKWIGTTETYRFTEVEDGTLLKIEMETHEDFVQMFDNCWPKALMKIKALSEV